MKSRGSKRFSIQESFETNVAKSTHVNGTQVEKHSTVRETTAGSKIGIANQEEKETNIQVFLSRLLLYLSIKRIEHIGK